MLGNCNDGNHSYAGDVDRGGADWIDTVAPVGICTLDGIVGRDLLRELNHKLNIL